MGESIILLIVINFILDLGLVIAPELRHYLVAFMIVVGISSEVIYIKSKHPTIDKKWIKYSIITILSAFAIWVVDISKLLCNPESIFQGHALWHILSTLSIYVLYRYYVSERSNCSVTLDIREE